MAIARRLYLYGIASVALAVWAIGAVRLLRALASAAWELVARPAVVGDAETFRRQLSVSVALLVVGFPIWAVHWWLVERQAAADEAERRSAVRAVFFTVVLSISFSFWLASGIELVRLIVLALLGVAEPAGASVPRVLDELTVLLVAGTLWLGHARAAREEHRSVTRAGAADWLPRLYGYGAAGSGIVLLVVGTANLLRLGLDSLLVPTAFAGTLRYPLATQTSLLVGGAVAWALHWGEALVLVARPFPAADRERRSLLRWTYLGFAVFAGLAVMLVALAAFLHEVLRWVLGVPDGDVRERVRQLLDPLAWLLPVALVWHYHRRVMEEEATALAARPVAGPDWARGVSRFLLYLSAFASLALAVLGLGGLVGLFLQVLLAALTAAPLGTWREDLAFQLSVASVGGIAWLALWRAVLVRVAREPAAECASLSRRAYLYGTLGLSVLVILGTAGYVIYRAVGLALGLVQPLNALSDAAPAFGFTLVALGVLVYHAAVLVADTRAAVPQRAAVTVRLVLRLPPESDADAVVQELTTHLPPGAVLERAT
ncbi:DUF5671 domain-containing protein [Thermomicrobium sp. 4228-Ro]|uniref:DUF5671 domain-containing protein n=1 Tax=Thermomicrobium sp. 4228-Ro TaxID=2993937 RepID=UPI0022495103|nr:DUF5671 domain-containing protein [Thermomicrobium sp. 4228-Ro]MCX2728337.1 DUF5671 domain-containing protein [Thermomicrobium sp. 4228-Ro]